MRALLLAALACTLLAGPAWASAETPVHQAALTCDGSESPFGMKPFSGFIYVYYRSYVLVLDPKGNTRGWFAKGWIPGSYIQVHRAPYQETCILKFNGYGLHRG